MCNSLSVIQSCKLKGNFDAWHKYVYTALWDPERQSEMSMKSKKTISIITLNVFFGNKSSLL